MFKFFMKILDQVATIVIALVIASLSGAIIHSGDFSKTVVNMPPWVIWLIFIMALLHFVVALFTAVNLVQHRRYAAILDSINRGPLRNERGDII